MRLAEAEVIPYRLPFQDRYVSAQGELRAREMVLLRIRSEDGATGLGEAVPLSLRGGASLATVAGELRRWTEEPTTAIEDLSAPAHCAIGTALLDLEAQRTGVPAWSLLGADGAEPVECNAT